MAYPGSFLRLVLSGDLYTVEGWSMGFSLIPNFDTTPDQPAEVPAGVISAATTLFGLTHISNKARLKTIKLNLIGPDGRYVSQDETVLHDFPTPVAGGGPNSPPPQIALAVTLRTGAMRGLASSGRVYLPAPNPVGAPDTGLLGASTAESVANAVAAFINSVNAALPTYRVGVVSDVREGQFRTVESVECGRTLDTIRSRRRSLPEGHVPATTLITP